MVGFGEGYLSEPVSTSEVDILGVRRRGSTGWVVWQSWGLGGTCGRFGNLGDRGEEVFDDFVLDYQPILHQHWRKLVVKIADDSI